MQIYKIITLDSKFNIFDKNKSVYEKYIIEIFFAGNAFACDFNGSGIKSFF